MKNLQLTEILGSFDKTELKEFEKFVQSPYFNNRSEVTRFFNSIKKFHPDFDSKEFSPENIFKKVYPGKKYNDVLIRKLNSLTTNLLMDFIAVKGFREDILEYNSKLAYMLLERKLPGVFEKRSKILDDLLKKSKRDLSYYEFKLKHTSVLNGHFLNTNEKSMAGRLQNELNDLIEYFLVVAVVQYIRFGEWSPALNIKFDLKFYKEVTNYISSKKENEVTLSDLYYNMLMLLKTGEESYYVKLMKGREKFETYLSELDDYNIAIVSMQYCHKRVAKGDSEYKRHQFDITKKLIDKDLIPAGFIEPYFFTNIVRNASGISEFKWAEEFIGKFKSRLNPDHSQEITDYSCAMLELSKGNFESALKFLSKINMERSNMKLDIKNLIIIIYYELNYQEELISLIDTYKHFLQRDKSVTAHSKKFNSLFLKFVSEMIKIKNSNNKSAAFILNKEIENVSYFLLKDWLLKKSSELLK
ncbi:MAG TPA: hypothetical protein PKD83_05240 [Ignavibacteria bacterium]|nr:hypothetical protein [Ignavibacteria bacterium]